jgi:hypothetical protein
LLQPCPVILSREFRSGWFQPAAKALTATSYATMWMLFKRSKEFSD